MDETNSQEDSKDARIKYFNLCTNIEATLSNFGDDWNVQSLKRLSFVDDLVKHARILKQI